MTGWTRPEPGDTRFLQVSHVGDKQQAWSHLCCFIRHTNKELLGPQLVLQHQDVILQGMAQPRRATMLVPVHDFVQLW